MLGGTLPPELSSEQRVKHSVVQSQGLHPSASLPHFPPLPCSTEPIAVFLWMTSQKTPCVIPPFPLPLPTQQLPLSPRSHLTQYGQVEFSKTTYCTGGKKKVLLIRLDSRSLVSLLQHSLSIYVLTSFNVNPSFLPDNTSGFTFPHPMSRPSHSSVFLTYCPLFPYF